MIKFFAACMFVAMKEEMLLIEKKLIIAYLCILYVHTYIIHGVTKIGIVKEFVVYLLCYVCICVSIFF